ncbi:MAG: hypothetical protein WDN27_00390 [Candidatus Saccharibacteria bacterium]
MPKPDLIDAVPAVYRQPAPHEYILRPLSLRRDPAFGGPAETLEARAAIAAVTGLVLALERSKKAAESAVSWRDYRVGACAAMVDFEHGLLAYFGGYNVKPAQAGGLNLHAEQVCLAKGRYNGLNRALGIAILADPADADANPHRTPTLCPCSRCITMFEDAPEVDERLLILGANEDLSVCELYTFGQIRNQGAERELLHPKPFSLRSEADLETFDHDIKPQLVMPIYELYGISHPYGYDASGLPIGHA